LESNLVRAASIDLGSNSTRMLIADITNGTLTTIYKEHQVTRMADKLSETKIISKEATKRVLKVLAGYFKTINKINIENIQIVGTAALRDAKNSQEIIQLIERKFGFEVDIVSGEEEGVLTSVGVLNSLGSLENFLIVDIGGRSTEFIYDDDKKIVSKSVNIGVVSLSELFFNKLPPPEKSVLLAREYIENNLLESNEFHGRLLVGVAGTFTSLASIFLEQTQFNEKEIHLTELKNENVFKISNELLHLNEPQIITKYKGLDPKRAKTIQAGILLAKEIISKYNVNSIKVSNSDILEGLILKKY
jgi:exopolyphosphatase/guanosine-5'-triphosphate,3'-diphosphate pyrophosphatase